jgi:glutamine phosphoribosylpyrophosphate amidotransferase
MHEAVRAEPRTFCDACFTGEYLVELTPPVGAERRGSVG